MSDRKRRELERLAQQGDTEAEERLYWDDLRIGLGGIQLLDKLVEAVLALKNKGRLPSVTEKRLFVNGLPHNDGPSPQRIAALADVHRTVQTGACLHRIPRVLRQEGFTTYVEEQRAVYRISSDGQWSKVCSLSADPPAHPFYVFRTLRDRDESTVRSGSCLVMANGGVYRADGGRGPMGGNRNNSVHWQSIRIEKVRGR